jgi:hypothetical protein
LKQIIIYKAKLKAGAIRSCSAFRILYFEASVFHEEIADLISLIILLASLFYNLQ